MTKTKSKRTIPEFTSYEEEAHFWDTHDVTDYWDEMKPANVTFKIKNSGEYSKVLSVRLDEQTYDRINEEARKKGIGPTTLARMVLFEKYHPHN